MPKFSEIISQLLKKFKKKVKPHLPAMGNKLVDFLVVGILATLLINVYSDMKAKAAYKEMLRGEVVGNMLLASRNIANPRLGFWYFRTETWEAGFETGHVLSLNLEYRVALAELYNWIDIVNSAITDYQYFITTVEVRDASIPDGTPQQENFIKEKEKFTHKRVENIQNYSKYIESDIGRALELRKYTFGDWIVSLWD